MVPVVDGVEIGQGGGSIAWVDDFGKLHVGPQSAGAVPGPAAYGRGGTSATTTDANLALGRINPDYFCGGEIQADMHAVERALGEIAQKLGVDTAEAAEGVVRIANNNMVNALKAAIAPMSASTRSASTRPSSSSGRTSSRSRRSASSFRRRSRRRGGGPQTHRRDGGASTTPRKASTKPTSMSASSSSRE